MGTPGAFLLRKAWRVSSIQEGKRESTPRLSRTWLTRQIKGLSRTVEQVKQWLDPSNPSASTSFAKGFFSRISQNSSYRRSRVMINNSLTLGLQRSSVSSSKITLVNFLTCLHLIRYRQRWEADHPWLSHWSWSSICSRLCRLGLVTRWNRTSSQRSCGCFSIWGCYDMLVRSRSARRTQPLPGLNLSCWNGNRVPRLSHLLGHQRHCGPALITWSTDRIRHCPTRLRPLSSRLPWRRSARCTHDCIRSPWLDGWGWNRSLRGSRLCVGRLEGFGAALIFGVGVELRERGTCPANLGYSSIIEY